MRLRPALLFLILSVTLLFSASPGGAQTLGDALLVAEAPQPAAGKAQTLPLELFFQIGPLTMSQSSTQETKNPGEAYPPDASFSQDLFDGPGGFTTSLGAWWKLDLVNALGATTRIRWFTYKLAINDKILEDTASDVMVLGVYRRVLSPILNFEAGLGYHKLDGVFFRYTDGKSSADLLNMSTHGIRISGAATGNVADIHYRMEVGETFGPMPAATTLSAEAAYKLPNPISQFFPVYVGIQYLFAYRALKAETNGATVSVSGTENMFAITIGGTYGGNNDDFSFLNFGSSSQEDPLPLEPLPQEEDVLDL